MLKRLFDIIFASVGLIVFSPIYLLLYILIRKNLGHPVLFKQQRPGLHGEPFYLYKYRSMKEAFGDNGEPLPDEQRLTNFGKKLRSSSLDELPSLLNVLKGEMSLVGPRPLLMRYLDRYNDEQKRRHNVRPGVTGWAQVNGRNAISWEEKFKLDVWYVDNRSLFLDIKIILMTIKKVFFKEDISATGHETMPEFMGTNNE